MVSIPSQTNPFRAIAPCFFNIRIYVFLILSEGDGHIMNYNGDKIQNSRKAERIFIKSGMDGMVLQASRDMYLLITSNGWYQREE